MFNIGDKVIVKNDIEIIQEGEEKFCGKVAHVELIDDFIFPVELRFIDPEIQKFYEEFGLS